MPANPAFWPPAPGWWIVAALVVGILLLGAFYLWRKNRRTKWQNRILGEVDEIINRHKERTAQLAGLSALLRRTALRRYPREQIATLHGKAWLEFLDRHSNGQSANRQSNRQGGQDKQDRGAGTFLQPPARALAYEVYQNPGHTTPLQPDDPLVQLVRNWIRRNLS